MEVKPSKENGLRRQFDKILKSLSLLGKSHNFRAIFEADLLGEAETHNLPENTQNNVMLFLNEGLRVNTWQFKADTLAGVDSEVQVLLSLIDI